MFYHRHSRFHCFPHSWRPQDQRTVIVCVYRVVYWCLVKLAGKLAIATSGAFWHFNTFVLVCFKKDLDFRKSFHLQFCLASADQEWVSQMCNDILHHICPFQEKGGGRERESPDSWTHLNYSSCVLLYGKDFTVCLLWLNHLLTHSCAGLNFPHNGQNYINKTLQFKTLG